MSGFTLAEFKYSEDVTCAAQGLPVNVSPGTFRTLLRVVVPVQAGDTVDVHADTRVTNDVGRDASGLVTGKRYIVGVGWHLWMYPLDDGLPLAQKTWVKIGSSLGQNVTIDTHHMALAIDRVFEVPDNWPADRRAVFVLRGDAHSTQALVNGGGDTLTVDNLGIIIAQVVRPTAL